MNGEPAGYGTCHVDTEIHRNTFCSHHAQMLKLISSEPTSCVLISASCFPSCNCFSSCSALCFSTRACQNVLQWLWHFQDEKTQKVRSFKVWRTRNQRCYHDYCILLYIHSACVLDRGRNRRNLNSWDLVTACSTAFYTTFYTVFPQCPRLCSSITSCLLRLFVSSAILVLRYHWWDCSKLQLGVLCQVQANKRKKHESCSMLQLPSSKGKRK